MGDGLPVTVPDVVAVGEPALGYPEHWPIVHWLPGKHPEVADERSEIAEALNSGYILSGSVRRAGDQICISLQLIDASADDNLWSETYDRDMTDIFAAQSEVAESASGQLQVALNVETKRAIATPPTNNDKACELYLRGLVLAALEQALTMVTQATELDPNFAEA